MNDKLIMENYLLVLKSTVEVYVHGTLESSNCDVRKLLHTCLVETLKHQANTYEEMVGYEWYNVENIKTSCVKQVLDKLCSEG